MNRFLKTFALLIVSLFLLVTGVDATLDRLERARLQNTYTLYSDEGAMVIAYNGDMDYCPSSFKPGPIIPHRFLHRFKASS
jgi:hypothetical protein